MIHPLRALRISALLVVGGFFLFFAAANAQSVTYDPLEYYWFAGEPTTWINAGYNANNMCTITGEMTVAVTAESTGILYSVSGVRMAMTRPSASDGDFNFFWYATSTDGTAMPDCSLGGCSTSTYTNTIGLQELPWSTDPNDPNRSLDRTGTPVSISFDPPLDVEQGDTIWIAPSITCDGITGTLPNHRLWVLAMESYAATTMSPLDGVLAGVMPLSQGTGISTTTLESVSVYDITATSTASAQFSCDQFGTIAEGLCNVAIWLFAPDNSSIQFFITKKNALLGKVPFGYFTEVGDALSEFGSTTSTTGNLDITVPVGVDHTSTTVTVIDISSIDANDGLQAVLAIIRTLTGTAIGLAALVYVWTRITDRDLLS
mgnify:CR=1 FL=1